MNAEVPSVSIGFVSTSAPTVWRPTTRTESLIGASAGEPTTGNGLGVVDMAADDGTVDPRHAVHRHGGDDAGSFGRAWEVRNPHDTVSIQHELGILAGPDGATGPDHVFGPSGEWPWPSIGRRPTGSLTESIDPATVVETGEARLEAVRVTV